MKSLINDRVNMKSLDNLKNADLFVPTQIVSLQSLTNMPSRRGFDQAIICGGEIVNIVSSSYGFLSNEVFFKSAEQNLHDAGLEFVTRSVNRQNRSFACDYILNDPNVTIELKQGKKTDRIKPMLRFVNSYDGSIRTSGSFGFFREVCSNGLHIATSKIGFYIKHHKSSQELIMPSVNELVQKFIDNEFYTLRRKFEVMYDCQVDHPLQYIREICDRSRLFKFQISDTNVNASKNANLVLDIANAEADLIGVPMNRWLIYNAFNNVLHNKLNKSFKVAHQFDHDLFEIMSEPVLN